MADFLRGFKPETPAPAGDMLGNLQREASEALSTRTPDWGGCKDGQGMSTDGRNLQYGCLPGFPSLELYDSSTNGNGGRKSQSW